MLALEVIVRGSSNFIGFPDICSKALLDAGFVVMLFLVLHLLGGLLEIGSRSVHFAASLFYYRISRGPKGSNTSTSLISSNSVHRLGERNPEFKGRCIHFLHASTRSESHNPSFFLLLKMLRSDEKGNKGIGA